jgi:RNA polymerase sigma factor (sigma-70 family)
MNRGLSPAIKYIDAQEIDAIESDIHTDDALIQETAPDVLPLLQTLDDRERHIITYLYGLDGITLTQDEIGQELDISHQRVSQIAQTAITKMQGAGVVA